PAAAEWKFEDGRTIRKNTPVQVFGRKAESREVAEAPKIDTADEYVEMLREDEARLRGGKAQAEDAETTREFERTRERLRSRRVAEDAASSPEEPAPSPAPKKKKPAARPRPVVKPAPEPEPEMETEVITPQRTLPSASAIEPSSDEGLGRRSGGLNP